METASAGAIVIGRDYGALGVVRSLGRQRIPVWLLEEAPSNAGCSRYLAGRRRWPATEAGRLDLLRSLARDRGLGGWTLFPTSDESAALVARHHRELAEHFRLTTPPWEILKWAYDKRRTHELAERAGVDIPLTRYPKDRAELAAQEWTFPVVIKPATKPDVNALTAAKAWRVDDRAELLARYDEACALVDPATIMVQELIPGDGSTQLSFVALCRDGAPIASFVARRARQYPLDFGRYSTFVQSIACQETAELSHRLLAEMRYSGLVEIEYKRDPLTGAPKLLDVNGRVWSWHTLGRRAGVDFPYLQWRLANGLPVAEASGRPGVHWMRGLVDVPAALLGVRAGTLSLQSYLAGLRPPLEWALFAPDDPLPWLLDAPLMLMRRHRLRPVRTPARRERERLDRVDGHPQGLHV